MASSMLRIYALALCFAAAIAAPSPASVMTPHGIRPIANVHEVPEGGEVRLVGSEIHLVDSTGSVVHVGTNDNITITAKASPTASSVEPYETGWVAYADWYNHGSSPISSFTTTWTVPAAPTSNDGQTVFLFNSIEPASGNAILQPVLQYGPSAAGGGSYWSVASWYLVGSQTYFTKPVRTTPGTSLTGVISLQSKSGSTYNYAATFSGIASTSIRATGSAQLVWATETLEVYGIKSLSDYPTGSTVFQNIVLRTQAGTPSVTWATQSDAADGVTATVNTQGATNAKITITY